MQVHLFKCELRLERKQWFGRRLGAFGRLFCRQWCSRAVGNLCGGAGATWQERSRLPGRACQCQQGAAHGIVRAAATLSAAFARPRVAAFASPRPCAARRCQKTLIALVPAGRSSLRPRCVELARVRPGASMHACPDDIFSTFLARGACVPLFQRPQNAPRSVSANLSFLVFAVFNRACGLAGVGSMVLCACPECASAHKYRHNFSAMRRLACCACVRQVQDFDFPKSRTATGHRRRSAHVRGTLAAVRGRDGTGLGGCTDQSPLGTAAWKRTLRAPPRWCPARRARPGRLGRRPHVPTTACGHRDRRRRVSVCVSACAPVGVDSA